MADLGKILLMPKGSYGALTTYTLLDVVTYERSSYVLKVASAKGIAPTDTNTWQLLSAHGEDAYGFGYIRYSKYEDGAEFVESPTEDTKYIGFYMGNSATAPTRKQDYKWSKFMGEDGKDGDSLTATHSKVGTTTTVTIKDKNTGTTIDTFQIEDGESGSGSGDMLKSVYDTDNNGTVDNAEAITDGTSRMTYSDLNTALSGKLNEPATEGSSGQALITDGNGGRSWQTVATDQYITSTTDKFNVSNKKLDLSSGVKTSLGKADSAYQKPSGGIPESDLSSTTTAKLSALNYTSSDSGKALKVKEDGSALEWGESGSDEFIGTTSQWNAISDKQKYIGKVVNITDDYNEPIASGSLTDAYGETDLWSGSNVDYAKDDYVIDDGKLFKCILAHTSSSAHEPISDTTHWQRVSLKQLNEIDNKFHVGDRLYLASFTEKCIANGMGYTISTTAVRIRFYLPKIVGSDVSGCTLHGNTMFRAYCNTNTDVDFTINETYSTYAGYDFIQLNSNSCGATFPYTRTYFMPIMSGSSSQPSTYSDLYIEFI